MAKIKLDNIERPVLGAISQMCDYHDQLGLIVIGSMAHQLDNATSDIDIMAVDFSGRDYGVPVRQLTHVGKQRCEIYFASPRDLEALSEKYSNPPAISDHQYELYLRICYGHPVNRLEQIADSLPSYTRHIARERFRDFLGLTTLRAITEAKAALALGLDAIAVCQARLAVRDMLRNAVNEDGRYFTTSEKYLVTLAERLNVHGTQVRDLLLLWGDRIPAEASTYVCRVVKTWNDITKGGYNNEDIESLKLVKNEELEVVEVMNARALRDGDVLFLVRPDCGERLEGLLKRGAVAIGDLDAGERELASALVRHSLASLRSETITIKFHAPSWPGDIAPCAVTTEGHDWPIGCVEPLIKLALSLKQISTLAYAVFINGINYANAREDAVGAIRSRRWSQVDGALARMATSIVLAYLAYRGVDVRPEYWNYAGIHKLLERDEVGEKLSALIVSAANITVDDEISALSLYRVVERLDLMIPQHILKMLRKSMENGDIHEYIVVDVGNRLAALAALARGDRWGGPDRRAMSGGSPHFREMQQKASKKWSRSDDIRKELKVMRPRSGVSELRLLENDGSI